MSANKSTCPSLLPSCDLPNFTPNLRPRRSLPTTAPEAIPSQTANIFHSPAPNSSSPSSEPPNLSNRYAQFRVPLNFNKLDMRDYLERAYGVGVVSVRSYVQLQPITRITKDGRQLGAWRRPKSEKRMTVELRDPFVWPEEPTDLSKWEKESWNSQERVQTEQRRENVQKPNAAEKPDEKLRKAFKKQAEELKKNKETWRPTWKVLGLDFAHKEMANMGKSVRPPKWQQKP
ncbi:dicer-like protein 1 [Penicillium atrosanguineum]|uniref:dicer-like protein 1 n=1 Tax=Penicillium atrosanguineum TaxID=1132637 RepID=UPI00239A5A88|nr:dicer-like protein 1 [Penicillium atrosanguineum]KAJ5313496.1 dicer-like protein 1 [Penicillium atrosanguineum]